MNQATPGGRRVLLLEFVTHERWVYESRYFPFVQGLARDLGDTVRWVCLGSRLAVRRTGPLEIDLAMHLDPEDVAVLARHLQELRPTHVMMNENVEPEVLALLQGRSPAPAILSTNDHPCPPGVIPIRAFIRDSGSLGSNPATAEERRLAAAGDCNWAITRTDWLLRWLGLAPGDTPLFGRYLAGAARPDFQAHMANAAASQYRPHLILVGGVACDHRKPVAKNPLYRDLDLSGCPQDYGCAMCTWYRGPASDLSTDPVELAEAQLRRVMETTGGQGRCCGVYDLLDVRVFAHVDRFLERVVALGLPPSQFCFEPRIDAALGRAKRLERALALASTAGHSVYLHRMGAENLVDEENARFNKWLTRDQLDQGMERLEALAAKHPGALDFDRSFGYITCGPWTTLDNLSETVERGIERGMEPKGIWLYTPLQLHPGAPITLLAQRDGLLTDTLQDVSLLYEPAINNSACDGFHHWRFRDERVATAYSLVVRFSAAALRGIFPDGVFDGDGLYAHLLSHATGQGFLERPDLFAREAVRAAREAADPRDRCAVLDVALARYGEVLAALPPAPPAATDAAGDGTAPGGPAEDPRLARIRALVGALLDAGLPALQGIRARVEPVPGDGQAVRFQVAVDDRDYEVFLTGKAPDRAAFFETPHYKVTFGRRTAPASAGDLRRIQAFFLALDGAASRRVRRDPAP